MFSDKEKYIKNIKYKMNITIPDSPLKLCRNLTYSHSDNKSRKRACDFHKKLSNNYTIKHNTFIGKAIQVNFYEIFLFPIEK